MASSFAGQMIFASGPHRFMEGARGSQLLSNGRLNPTLPGTTSIGSLETTVVVRGRLVAGTESGLWTLRDAIAALTTSPPTRGTLVDEQGRTWNDLDFVSFTPGDRTDRGRTYSLAYEARFVKLTG